MNIILLGPPGSGKGTQSEYIIKEFDLKLISFGNILRKTFLYNNSINKFINKGYLINNKLANKIIKNYIFNDFNINGYLFDGYPRNIIQAKYLNFINIDFVIELYLPSNIIIDRLLNRKIHLNSGRVYNIKYNPPIVEGLDDYTGEKLISRIDDLDLNIIKKRILIYKKLILNLKNFYKNYFGINNFKNKYLLINANNNIDFIKKEILSLLNI